MNILEYIAAISLFDGHISIRPGKDYEIIIADKSRKFLEILRSELIKHSIRCYISPGKRDKAYRLRIYGKEITHKILSIQQRLIREKNKILLAAAIDAEGNVKKYRNQPFRTRIVLKRDWKANLIEEILSKLNIEYRKYRHCRKRNECNYVLFLISNMDNNRVLYSKIKIIHPDKIKQIISL